MAEYWERAIAPFWDLIRAVLEADIRQRARHLAGGGALELFAGLHPDVRWHDGALLVDRRHEADGRARRPRAPARARRVRLAARWARCSTRRGSRR